MAELPQPTGLLDLPQTVCAALVDHLVRVSNAGVALRLTLVGAASALLQRLATLKTSNAPLLNHTYI
jgi:hypothetical protein